MKPELRRILFALALLVWSAVLLYFYATGRIAKYLAPDFRPLTLVGGLGLAVVGLFNLLTARLPAACGHDHGDGGADGCGDHEATDIHPLAALLLMVLPISLAVGWTKDEYSTLALTRKGLYDAPPSVAAPFFAANLPAISRDELERTHNRTADDYYQFNLMEIFFAAGDREYQNALDGMKIETEGRWIDEKVRNPNGTRKRLYRLFLTCCVADSRAIPIVLEYNAPPPSYPENEWVRVAGTLRFPLEQGLLQPVLDVERTLAADPPFEESFLRY